MKMNENDVNAIQALINRECIYDVYFYNMIAHKQYEEKAIYKKLFPYVKPEHILNGEYRYMSTVEDSTNTMRLIKLYVKTYGKKKVENMSIADAFACLGGNTYFFAEAFAHVSAYEIDETRREHLEENIGEFYRRSNVDVYADCVAGENSIFKNVKEQNAGQTRIFCFGIGTDVNTHLLDKITEETKAFSTYVLPEEDLENIKSILDVNARKSALLTAAQKAHTVVLNEVRCP